MTAADRIDAHAKADAAALRLALAQLSAELRRVGDLLDGYARAQDACGNPHIAAAWLERASGLSGVAAITGDWQLLLQIEERTRRAIDLQQDHPR